MKTHLGTFRSINNIIGNGYGLCARDGTVLLAVLFVLVWMTYLVLAGMAPVTV